MASFQVPVFDTSRFPLSVRAFIGGEFVDSTGDEKHSLISSVNDQVLTNGSKDLNWTDARRDALVKYGNLIQQNREQLHWLETVLTGKDAGFCDFEVNAAADLFIYYGNMIDKFNSEYTLRQPWGICAGICPFNGVIVTLAMKAAPALACSNSIIIKTSETNPFSTLFMTSLAIEAGIPPGALNCLVGGAEAGNALSSHMDIRKISFTGSIGVGKLIQIAAAKSNLKSVTLELGGKSPIIVFPDANLEAALLAATLFLLMNGQGCALPTRLYVHESIAEEFIGKVKDMVEGHAKTLGGDPTAASTYSSPLYHHRQKDVVLSYIESGKVEAKLITGGNAVGEQGCYVEPTIFVDPAPDARVLREEIFGPVLVVVRFSTDDEVLKLANDTEYGLAASIWTADMKRALRFANKLEAGSVSVNGAGDYHPSVPMGGWKQSGQGLENGKEAMLDWTQLKSVALRE
ncbi:aldehyde dehydrogenase domain-containing protein [Fusarium solani]|uniref:aldehyde dehydrogenase (NAD(+)) n=1 Tax=Fusarium solani TaxID=169388 RepID=A0A9P9HZE0_FUSSL|nr:aldehyde dehydrogenase domain-containing protein [Fusarium solani]KAH7266176.1 aldehyde dehydrogenase domain-containing protein [Fusarium solani]